LEKLIYFFSNIFKRTREIENMRKDLKILLGVILCWGILFHPSFLRAVEITPFYTQNQSPIIQIFGLPSVGDASLVPSPKIDLRLIADLTNNFIENSNLNESIILDGENTRLSLDARYGISRNFEVGVVIPYLIQRTGFLDGFIDRYHNTFGFPEGGRDQSPTYRLLYRYKKDNQVLLNVDHSSQGIGDVQINGGFQLYQSIKKPSQAISLRASLKLPTGDSDELRGSGSTDFSLWITAGDDYKVSIGQITLFGSAGIMAMTEGNVLSDQQRHFVGFGVLGAGWSPARWIAFKIQANGHTAFYKDSNLEEVSGYSVQLTTGGTLAFSRKTTLDLGITEDLILRASPDVVFHLNLRHRF